MVLIGTTIRSSFTSSNPEAHENVRNVPPNLVELVD
jgi:hypothetical protein